MPDNILSQDEVDALLKAVETGDVKIKKETPGTKKTCVKYDFRNPNLIPKEGMHLLRALHENFSRSCTVAISAITRVLVQIKLISIDQITYNEFLMSLPEFSCLNVVSLVPIKGSFVLQMDPNILFFIIEKLLGGKGTKNSKLRPLSELETAIAVKIFNRILEEYKSSWKKSFDISPKIETSQCDMRMVQIVKANETVVLVSFEFKIAEYSGMLNFCFPSFVFEPLIAKLMPQKDHSGNVRPAQTRNLNKMQEAMINLPLTLSAQLDKIFLPAQEIVGLKQGDILRLTRPVNQEVKVSLGKKNIYHATVGLKKNKKVAMITNKLF